MKPKTETKSNVKAAYQALPLVYACSGCSSAAQLANALAVRLDRERLAEMSCIAGVGGDVRSLVRVAQARRKILVLDGCPLHCAKHCLDRHGHRLGAHALHRALDHRRAQRGGGHGPVAAHRLIQVDQHHHTELRGHAGERNEADGETGAGE